ncbi:RNA-processing protein [Saccharomycopsis crataegensis]|uniref:RNA-processing protein n=1 Tax=Saccharomycopsis crataegensis TaxID=43959 RepID=A0AAV5QFZ0_9ASCO|nr:RNA-processing protein [Saccharomycopsis crataegensis]
MEASKNASSSLGWWEQAKKRSLEDISAFPQEFGRILVAALEVSPNQDTLPVISWCLDFLIFVFTNAIDDSECDTRIDAALKKSLLLTKYSIHENTNGQKAEVYNVMILKFLNELMVRKCCYSVEVFRKVVQLSCIIYNQSFLNVLQKSADYNEIWDELVILKSAISSKLGNDTAFPVRTDDVNDVSHLIGPKLLIVRFIGIVVQSQLPTPPKDPRKRDRRGRIKNDEDVSISMTRSHPLINENLKAQAMGLLDSLLVIITDEEKNVPQIISAIMFSLINIIKKRPSISSKILNSLLNFDSSRRTTPGCENSYHDNEAKILNKLSRRFSDRSFKLLLNNLFKNGTLNNKEKGVEQDPLSAKFYTKINYIHQYQDKQRKDKNLLKDLPEDLQYYQFLERKADEDKISMLLKANPKLSRRDVDNIGKYYPQVSLNEITNADQGATMGGSESYSSLFTLTDVNNDLNKFDAGLLNNEILTKLILIAIERTRPEKLSSALNVVGERYRTLSQRHEQTHGTQGGDQKRIKLDAGNDLAMYGASYTKLNGIDSNLDYVLPAPKKMTPAERKEHLSFIISNYLKLAESKELQTIIDSQNESNNNNQESKEPGHSQGIIKMSKVAISRWDKNSWATLLIRLATRGLNNGTDDEKQEMSDMIRQALFNHFLENIHNRIDIVIDWLNEEWYSEYVKGESLMVENGGELSEEDMNGKIETPTYIIWTVKVLDSIIPFLETKDRKIFIRLLSDLPYLNKEIITKLKSLCLDRLRFGLGLQSLQYLVLVRPPVKEICIEMLIEIYNDVKEVKEDGNEEVFEAIEKLLKKIEPAAVNTEVDKRNETSTAND